MAEPTASQYPTAYDDDSTLLGAVLDQRSFTLSSICYASATSIDLPSGAMTGIDLPVYFTFDDAANPEDNEIVYCEALDTGGDPVVTRGALGTIAQQHASGSVMYLAYYGKHATQLLKAMLTAQKFQGIVGSGDPAPTALPPEHGQAYVDSTNQRVWFSDDSAWDEVGPSDHGRWDDLGDDDHTNYHNDSRKALWHKQQTVPTASHCHVQDGDSHDHSKGAGAGRIQSGPYSGLGTASYEREIYYDLDNDELYIADATLTWVKIVGAPQYAIGMWTDLSNHSNACPSGWTRKTDLDDRFPLGCEVGQNPADYGTAQVEGSDTHTHTYSDIPTHSHTVTGFAASMSASNSHSHSVPVQSASGGNGYLLANSRNTTTVSGGSVSGHTHTVDMPADSTSSTKRTSDDAASVAQGTSGSTDAKPPYMTVIFCEKN